MLDKERQLVGLKQKIDAQEKDESSQEVALREVLEKLKAVAVKLPQEVDSQKEQATALDNEVQNVQSSTESRILFIFRRVESRCCGIPTTTQ
jgi:hypothetical protein